MSVVSLLIGGVGLGPIGSVDNDNDDVVSIFVAMFVVAAAVVVSFSETKLEII